MKKKKSAQPNNLQIDDVVKVCQGFIDPDTGVDMGGWHGRITQLFPEVGTALITFDSITLQNLPSDYIEDSEVEGVSWNEYGYDLTDLTKVEPRDTTTAAPKILKQLEDKLGKNYFYLGEEGKDIQRIMRTIDPDGDLDPLYAWLVYLEQELKFPFEAVVDESQERGPLRSGDKVRVHAIEDADEHYGLIVKLRHGRKQFHLPLYQLAAANEHSTGPGRCAGGPRIQRWSQRPVR